MIYSTIHAVTQKRLCALLVLLAMVFGPFSSAFAQVSQDEIDVCTNIADIQITPPVGYSVAGGVCTIIPVDPADMCTNIADTQLTVPKGMASQNGVCVNVLVLEDEETTPKGACEFEGHKYNAKGTPLSGWAIGLMKVLTFGDRSENIYGLAEETTNKDGYYCLEWDGYTGTQVVPEAHSFMYRVYEVLQNGWSNISVEKGTKDANESNTLTVVDDKDILNEEGKVSVQVGEINGYVYADDAYHVDFYNKENVVIDPCDEEESTSTEQFARFLNDDCDGDSGEEDVPVCIIGVLEDVQDEANTETLAWASVNATSATLTQYGAIASTSVATGTATVTTTGLEETFTLTVFDDSEASSTCSVTINAPQGSSSNGGGGGGGNSRSKKPKGSVLGDATSTAPTGQVLGDATSVMPVGAPNTGAGSTSPIGVTLPTLVATLNSITTLRRTKNG